MSKDFLRLHGAVISFRDNVVAFTKNHGDHGYAQVPLMPLRVANEGVTLPPRSCSFVEVKCDVAHTGDGVAERAVTLILSRGVSIARGLVSLANGHAEVLLTNFSDERRQIPKGTTVAFFDSVPSDQDYSVLQLEGSVGKAPAPIVDVSPNLSSPELERLLDLIDHFRDCFASESWVGKTPLTKHRIITNDAICPIRQNPYRVAPKEREAIQRQVAEMLRDDVIQPSQIPWASPVVLV
ncbi:hypothetical protein V5799_006206 [Amblyomma americanum]|uniref:Uncharacterized protein n=1 Tax=Amblyomma americanum TaxID=6943 RepID=A0AAQ4DX20_AMBAM